MPKTKQTDDEQITAEQLTALTKARRHNEIEQLRIDGRLDNLLGVEHHPDDARPGEQIGREQVRRMFAARRFEEIEAARQAGLLTTMLADGNDAA